MAYYHKYMEYLASERAYELNVSMEQTPSKKEKTPRVQKSSSVQKIYGSNKSKLADLGTVD